MTLLDRWQSWRTRFETGEQAAVSVPSTADLAHAARALALRSRRQSAGALSGVYASAFRGSGMEFDESRPYVPGDDPRHFDWNAMARTGEPFVKHFREERDLTLLLALDVSGSMAFGPFGRNKAAVASHAAALLAAAADRAGDRVGLIAFDDEVRLRIPVARGTAHTWQLIRRSLEVASRPRGGTRLAAAVEGALAAAGPRTVVVLLSDFRADDRDDSGNDRSRLRDLARRHEVVAVALFDPHEQELPRAGRVRVADPERPEQSRVVDTSSRRLRARHRDAWEAWKSEQDRALRRDGADVLWLRTDRDPLRPLVLYFQQRASAGGSRAA